MQEDTDYLLGGLRGGRLLHGYCWTLTDGRAVHSTARAPGYCCNKFNDVFVDAQRKAKVAAHEWEEDMRARKCRMREYKITSARRMLANLTALTYKPFCRFNQYVLQSHDKGIRSPFSDGL